MSSAVMDIPTLNAAFKVQYADKMNSLVPDMAPIMSKVSFVSAEKKAGSTYIQPVILSLDQGFTCYGTNDQVISMQAPISHTIKQAQVNSCAYGGRSQVTYTALSRAMGGKQAFIEATAHIVESLTKSFTHLMEGTHWYGGTGLATVSAATAALNVSRVDVTGENSAAFLFLGGEGMPIEIWNSTSTAMVLSTEITAVDVGLDYAGNEYAGLSLKLASVTGLSNGTSYVIYRKGFAGVEAKGIKYMLTNDVNFGIDAAVNGLWRANRYAAGSSALSFAVLSKAVAKGIGRGLTGKLTGICNPKAFRQLMPDYVSLGDINYGSTSSDTQKSNRKGSSKDGDQKHLVHGVKEMNFYVDSVETSLESSEFCKGGDAFFLNLEDIIRVGSTAPTFNLPGFGDGHYFMPRPEFNSAELRILADESIFSAALNKQLIITGISGF